MRHYDEVIAELHRVQGVSLVIISRATSPAHHDLYLDPGDGLHTSRSGSYLRDDFARMLSSAKVRRLLSGVMLKRSAFVGDQGGPAAAPAEQWNHTPHARRCHTDHGKPDIVSPLEVVCRNEEFVGTELGGSVEIDRRRRLVCAQGDYSMNAPVDGHFDNVLGSDDVSLDRLEGIVFGHRNVLEGGCMNNGVDASWPATPIPRIADEVP
jgi:hypothetical protein